MARSLAVGAAIAVSLLAVSGAGGAGVQQTPKRGGTVVIAGGREPACFTPLMSACGDVGLNPVLEGAFELAPDFTYRPQLVSHVTVKREPFTLTYHIRPEARWSDGVPLTSSDFVFTFRRASLLPPQLRGAIESVQAVDGKTVKIVFRPGERFADWRPFLFQLILPRHVLRGEDLSSIWHDGIVNPKTGKPIGSGPFLVQSWERGGQLTVVRNPRYWGAHTAYLERIVLRFLDPAALAPALRSGEVELITTGAEAFLRNPTAGVRIASAPGMAWEHLEIRIGAGGNPALRNKLVRQALAYGIDRQALVREGDARLSGEIGKVRTPLNSVVFPTRSPFYRPAWNRYRYRPAEARRLLEQAGCRRGSDGVYSCNGERLSLGFVTTAGRPRRQLTLELIQEQLRRAGVEVRPIYATGAAFLNQILPSGKFDVALFAWTGGGPLLFPYYTFRCSGETNLTGYCSRLITRDLLQTPLIVDDSRRAALQNKIDAQLSKAVPAIPLFEIPALIALRTSVRNIAPNPGGDIAWNAEDWWLAK